jgi:hypothetical protein
MFSAAPAAAVMSIAGDVPGEGSEGEEVFIDDDDIINEIPLDEEGQYYLYKYHVVHRNSL